MTHWIDHSPANGAQRSTAQGSGSRASAFSADNLDFGWGIADGRWLYAYAGTNVPRKSKH